MGGGTPILEANRLGCSVIGVDVNPMSYWVVRQSLAALDRSVFRSEAARISGEVEAEIGSLYRTTCTECGDDHAEVKYFIWVKETECPHCGEAIALFPGFLLAKNDRHTHFVLACCSCGQLNQLEERPVEGKLPRCVDCGSQLRLEGVARRGQCTCASCGSVCSYPSVGSGPLSHRLIALEYHCALCRKGRKGRFFKVPDASDLRAVAIAEQRLSALRTWAIPSDEIPPGDESSRLHRWGYRRYQELFFDRQLLGLACLAERIAQVEPREVRFALATVFSDFLRYQNALCRYDTYALKVLDVFSIHGFPVSLVQCEANLLGIPRIGSGGFRHFVEKYDRAKSYCDEPFETFVEGGKKKVVRTRSELIRADLIDGDADHEALADGRKAWLRAESSAAVILAEGSLDAVLTDPPYFANVQYAELMDFCFQWLRRLVGKDVEQLSASTTRSRRELTGNVTEGRGLENFTEGLSQVFCRFGRALKRGRPFAFTYHHNHLDAYVPLVVAALDAGLVCSASLPCPGEMGASIHINGTGSATVDTLFVCRHTGRTRRGWLVEGLDEIRALVAEDLGQLRLGGCKPTRGDATCIAFGHLARMAIWNLRGSWESDTDVGSRMNAARMALREMASQDQVLAIAADALEEGRPEAELGPLFAVGERRWEYGDDVTF
jgi:adenine-specific DNA methylase